MRHLRPPYDKKTVSITNNTVIMFSLSLMRHHYLPFYSQDI